MTNALPVISRELHLQSRAKGTYWTRVVSGGSAFFALLWILIFSGAGNTTAAGQGAFSFLSFTAGALALILGVMNLAASVASEREEGTLGLLFLTPLRPFEVILGKMVSNSVGTIVALMGMMPVVGVTLTLGGVTGTELVARGIATLCLYFTAACVGVYASTVSLTHVKAVFHAAIILFVWVVFGSWADALGGTGLWKFGWLAPFGVTTVDGALLKSMTGCFVGSVICVTLATRWVSRDEQLQQRSQRWDRFWERWTLFWERVRTAVGFNNGVSAGAREANSLKDPLHKCASRMVGAVGLLRPLLLLLTVGMIGLLICQGIGFLDWDDVAGFILGSFVIVCFLLKLFAAFISSRVFERMLKSGEFELIVVSPVHGERFMLQLGGAFSRVFERFLTPTIVLMALTMLVSFCIAGSSNASAGVVTFVVGPVMLLYLIADLGALIWQSAEGVMLGRSMKTAMFRALGLVLVLPYLVMIVPICGWMLMVFSPLWSVFLMKRSQKKLNTNFRELVRNRIVESE